MAIIETSKIIAIDSVNLDISLIDTAPNDDVFAVPINSNSLRTTPFFKFVFFDVIYPLAEGRHKPDPSDILGMTRRVNKRNIPQVKFSLKPPDAWLICVVGMMWEGLVQGLTWEVIKVSVLSALDKLKSKGLAPTEIGSVEEIVQKVGKTKAKTQLGFTFRKYSADGKPLYDLFLGFKRGYEKKTEAERLRIRTK